MAYVKAATSERARKYLATVEGRRKLLKIYLGGAAKESPDSERAADSTSGGTSLVPKK